MNYIKYLMFLAAIFTPFAQATTYNNKKNAEIIKTRHRLDKRKTKSEFSPESLNAVGKLTSKRRKNKRDKSKLDCTATLIAPEVNMGSDIILTAKHCTSDEIIMYQWKSDTNKGEITRTAKLIYKDKENDWALLKLKKAVLFEEIKPLIIDQDTFDNTNFKSVKNENYMIAGFSVDWLGDFGKRLTYESGPSYIKFSTKDNYIGKVGALTHQGDSGGAVIYEENEQSYLVGLMSFISPDENLFKSTKGTFGNLSGYFIDLVKYKSLHLIVDRYF